MYNLNRAMILGNLTRDPEMRYTANGQAVTSFAIATNRSWTDQEGNRQDQTEYHDCVAWGKLAEIASQVLKKGQPAYIEGRLQTRSWDAPDGAKRQKTEIISENIIALQGRSSAAADGTTPYRPRAEAPAKTETDDKKTGTAEPKTDISIEDLDDIPF